MQLEARQLATAERQVASELGRTAQGESGKDAARRLAGDQERLAERTRKLQEHLQQHASSAAAEDAAGRKDGKAVGGADNAGKQKSARSAAGDAARDIETEQLAERMQKAADQMRAAADAATPKDPRAQAAAPEELARSLDKLADKLNAAAGSRPGADDETRKLSEQLARAQELRERMASISKEVERLGKPNSAGSSRPSQQKSTGETGRTGEGQQAGSGGVGSDLARLRDEYTRQLRQTDELVNQLKRDDPNFAKGGAGFTFEGQGMTLSAPGTEAFKQDFAAWEILRQQATLALEKAASTLSKKLQARQVKDRLAAGVDDKAPAEYQNQVDSYFKALAARKKP